MKRVFVALTVMSLCAGIGCQQSPSASDADRSGSSPSTDSSSSPSSSSAESGETVNDIDASLTPVVMGAAIDPTSVDLTQPIAEPFSIAHVPTDIGQFKLSKAKTTGSQGRSSTIATYFNSQNNQKLNVQIFDETGRAPMQSWLANFESGETVEGSGDDKITTRKYKRGELFATQTVSSRDKSASITLENLRTSVTVRVNGDFRAPVVPSLDAMWKVIDDTPLAQLFQLPPSGITDDVYLAQLEENKQQYALPAADTLLPPAEVARIGGHERVKATDQPAAPENSIIRFYSAPDHQPLIVMVTQSGGYQTSKDYLSKPDREPKTTVVDITDLGDGAYSAEYVGQFTDSDKTTLHRRVVFHVGPVLVELNLDTDFSSESDKDKGTLISIEQLKKVAKVVEQNLKAAKGN